MGRAVGRPLRAALPRRAATPTYGQPAGDRCLDLAAGLPDASADLPAHRQVLLGISPHVSGRPAAGDVVIPAAACRPVRYGAVSETMRRSAQYCRARVARGPATARCRGRLPASSPRARSALWLVRPRAGLLRPRVGRARRAGVVLLPARPPRGRHPRHLPDATSRPAPQARHRLRQWSSGPRWASRPPRPRRPDRTLATCTRLVDLASVAHSNDEDDEPTVVDLVDDPVVASAHAPLASAADQLARPGRAGPRPAARWPPGPCDAPKRPACAAAGPPTGHLDRVGHASPRSALTCSHGTGCSPVSAISSRAARAAATSA